MTHIDSPASPDAIVDVVRTQIANYLAEHRQMYAAMADAAEGSTWVVWRQDDHGHQAEVSRHRDRGEAEARAVELDGRGHKQTYWVAQAKAGVQARTTRPE